MKIILARSTIALIATFAGIGLCCAQTPAPTSTPPPVTCTPWPAFPSPTATPFVQPCGELPPEPTPSGSPFPVDIPSQWQLPSGQGVLQRRIYNPPSSFGAGPWHTVVVFHGGSWRAGNFNTPDVDNVCNALKNAGFLVISVNYRLAPCNLIPEQPDHTHPESGRPPEQIEDAKRQILAARGYNMCNGNLGVLGDSSGGTHAMWVTIDQGDAEGLDWRREDRPDAIACLSGIYDLSDQDDPATTTTFFIRGVENYTNSSYKSVQRFYSPVSLVSPYPPTQPVYLVQATDDIIPDGQLDDMVCALEDGGLSSSSISYWRIPNFQGHAFHYWDDLIKDTIPINTTTVGQRVIQFFNAHL